LQKLQNKKVFCFFSSEKEGLALAVIEDPHQDAGYGVL
jgi:hypothetical protein